jgi:hypothetical protein
MCGAARAVDALQVEWQCGAQVQMQTQYNGCLIRRGHTVSTTGGQKERYPPVEKQKDKKQQQTELGTYGRGRCMWLRNGETPRSTASDSNTNRE